MYLSNKRGECFGDLALPLGFTPWIPLLIKIRLLLDPYFLTYKRGCQESKVQVCYYKREGIRVYLFKVQKTFRQ